MCKNQCLCEYYISKTYLLYLGIYPIHHTEPHPTFFPFIMMWSKRRVTGIPSILIFWNH